MPTSRPRISVTKDPSLAQALEHGRRLLDSGAPEATLVRDLAIHGARLLADEHDQRSAALRDLGDLDWLDAVLDPAALGAVEANGLPTTP